MKRLLLLITICISSVSFGQQQFLKTYGTAMDEFLPLNLNSNLKKLDNGNYVLTGAVQDNKTKPFIIYLDPLFDTLSTYYYEINSSSNDYISGFELLGEDSIMVTGSKLTAAGNLDFYIGKTNMEGVLNVVKTTTSANNQAWPKLLDLGDSTYIVTSHATISSNNIESQVLRIDHNLNVLWDNLYAYKGNEGVLGLCKDSDTTITVVSVSRVSTNLADNDIVVSKIDIDGNTIWVKNLNGGNQDHIHQIISLDNGTLMTGYSINSSGDKDIIIAKFDENGDTLFVKTYGGNADDEGVNLIQEANGNFVVVGRTYSFGNGSADGFIMRISSVGDIISCKSFGTNADDYFSSILKYNSGFVLSGQSNGLSASADMFLLGIDSVFTDYFCPFQDTINMVEKSLSFSFTNQAFSTPNSLSYGMGTAIINNHTLYINNVNTGSDNVSEIVTSCDNYTWNANGQSYTQSGQYTTVLTNLQGCDSTITIELTVNVLTTLDGGADITVCEGDSVILSGSGAQSYAWNNGVTDGQYFTPTVGTTTYTATGTDVNGCEDTDDVIVSVSGTPELIITGFSPDCQGESTGSAQADVTGGISPYSFVWSNGSITSVIGGIPAGTYSVTVTDDAGCITSGEVIVTDGTDPCFFVPGGLSPNGDGNNDTWGVTGLDNYPDASVMIYNRWGQLLYDVGPDGPPWDGMYLGEELPTADYYYVIDLGNGEVYNGVVTLKR